jgi:hypothetical protein
MIIVFPVRQEEEPDDKCFPCTRESGTMMIIVFPLQEKRGTLMIIALPLREKEEP